MQKTTDALALKENSLGGWRNGSSTVNSHGIAFASIDEFSLHLVAGFSIEGVERNARRRD
jgi:hypothetical protein